MTNCITVTPFIASSPAIDLGSTISLVPERRFVNDYFCYQLLVPNVFCKPPPKDVNDSNFRCCICSGHVTTDDAVHYHCSRLYYTTTMVTGGASRVWTAELDFCLFSPTTRRPLSCGSHHHYHQSPLPYQPAIIINYHVFILQITIYNDVWHSFRLLPTTYSFIE